MNKDFKLAHLLLFISLSTQFAYGQLTIDTIGLTEDNCYLISSGEYRNAKKHGEWTKYKTCPLIDDSVMAEEIWHKGHILVRRSYDSLASYTEVRYSRSKGLNLEYRVVRNGVLSYEERLPSLSGQKRKCVEKYYANGVLREKGKLVGKLEWGELGTRIVYKKKGKWKYYNENGTLEKILIYREDKVLQKE